ncbi:MAG: methionine--tRNA ligase [Bacteroidia bacterium]|nr:methionine--tRNA ligase [Bacteroidia bacterium]MDW8133888.1 methionine--tRNA ligase [Bacteroidia bacterium]
MRYLITSALPYANGPLHIGHIAGAYLPADIFNRYLRLRGHETLFLCGSDEHGVAITLRAWQEKRTPQSIIDEYHPLLENSLRAIGIQMDYYGRTSDPLHHQVAQHFFLRLLEKGLLEEREVIQFWDPQAHTFLPDRYIVGTCPHCGYEEAYGDQCEKCGALLSPTELNNPRSRLSGAEPEKRPSRQYYFRLDLLQPQLEAYVQSREWKPNVRPVIESWLRAGLAPRAITRDLDWGVPLPLSNMQGKVLYVWFEAPLGYISIAQRWAMQTQDPQKWEIYWKNPETRIVHFIGKDNIVFHTLIFPAILLGVEEGYTLPYAVPANEFLNLEGRKISTSRQWSIDIHRYVAEAPERIDELRYVLTALMPQSQDRDFTWEEYVGKINNELIATLTNLIHRILTFLWRMGPTHSVSPHPSLIQWRREAAQEVGQRIESYDFSGALNTILSLAQKANKSLTESAPWNQESQKAREIVAGYGDLLAALGTLLEPFLPLKVAPTLRKTLDIPLFSWAKLESPLPLIDTLHLREAPTPLVTRVSPQEVERWRKALLPSPAPSSLGTFISIEDFEKIRLKVVTILNAETVPKANKLLKLTIQAEDGIHTVVSGVAQFYTPDMLIGKQAIWVANLSPRTIKGIQSEGMLLFSEGENGTLVRVAPEKPVPPGSIVR